ncbi:MAG TPA: transcriptional regulator [Thermoplasmatales archaeon]|nr:transcriptional regulator [Thermoplasmatales archaeon]
MTLMKRDELLQATRNLLLRAGFYCSDICRIRPSSFDFIARRDNLLFIVKVLNNIDAITEEVAKELISLARFLEGVPIIVGRRTCSAYLEDDVVYFRYGVPIITYTTLENYLQGIHPFICAAPGGFYVNIDGEKLKRWRMEKGVSVGHLARIAGVSRRTIRLYESGERASIDVAERLAEFIGEDFIKPVNLWEEIWREEIDIRREVEDEMLRLLEKVGAFIFPTLKSPFSAISQIMDEKLLVGIKERRIVEKARIISNLARVAEKESVIFMDSCRRRNIEGVPVIVKEELKSIRDAEEIIELIEERK